MKFYKLRGYFLTEILKKRIKPETIQMPITGKCNSRCITCNIWKQHTRNDMDVSFLQNVVKDPYLSNVKNVGVNGGEPFLHKDFTEFISTIIKLPKLENIYLISNGLLTDRIISGLKSIRPILKDRNVKLNLTISLDGIDGIYTEIRGIPNGFQKVKNTIISIKNEKDLCDTLTIGTTVSINNVNYLTEINCFAKSINVPINFHIAVPNRRIYTNDDYERYSVLFDTKATLLATEFFFGLFKYSKSIKEKLLYYQNYYYLKNNGTKRISACNYKRQDLTIDENFNLYLCAKESNSIGNLKEDSIESILKKKQSKQELNRIMKTCDSCGHYITVPSIKGVVYMIKDMIAPAIWIFYRITK
ncbi:MAG: radical SAM protein [Lachnospira sp.]|nr:radical SAM protein [Lachnospira sp.]